MRILLVDDNIEFLTVLGRFLEADGRHEVVGKALGGREGLRMAQELDPDVAIVDYDMPGIDGPETVRRMKREAPGIRTVVITGLLEHEYAGPSLQAGADRFLAKHKIEELLSFLQSLTEAARS